MARSLNKVTLIGNLTRDPELRYTPAGTAVCTFGLATNRQWTTDSGEKKEDVEFHRIVAWNKLGELCAQLLAKGRKVYVDGRLQTRKWTGNDQVERTTTEIVISDMIILDSRGQAAAPEETFDVPEDFTADIPVSDDSSNAKQASTEKNKTDSKKTVAKSQADEVSSKDKKEEKPADSDSVDEDIPF